MLRDACKSGEAGVGVEASRRHGKDAAALEVEVFEPRGFGQPLEKHVEAWREKAPRVEARERWREIAAPAASRNHRKGEVEAREVSRYS